MGYGLRPALVCALGVTLVFTRRLQRPIDALTHAAQAMARSRYDTRVPAMGAGAEVDALAGAFNTMAAQLAGPALHSQLPAEWAQACERSATVWRPYSFA